MTMDTFRQIEKALPKGIEIVFCGMCEPFQNPNCTDMLLYAHKKGRIVSIYTTLMGLSLKNIKKILSTIPLNDSINRFVIHLPSKDNLENIIINQTYLSVLSKILSSNSNIKFHHHGKDLHPKIKKIIDKSSYKSIYIQPHNRAGSLDSPKYISSVRKRGKISCNCWGHIILPNGLVVLCPNDYKLNFVLGNILETPFSNLLTSPVLKKIYKSWQKENIDSPCRYCSDAKNIDLTAKYYNSPFTLSKIPTIIKMYFYKNHQKLYSVSRSLYKKILLLNK